MKILIVSYYELKDALLCVAEALRQIGYTVTNYPLFQMAYDVHSRRPDYAEHFAQFVTHEMPEVMFWWFTNVSASIIQFLRETCFQVRPNMFWLWFNWDDPWMWFDAELELEKKCPFFDCVAATSSAMLERYVACGAKRAIFVTPGFDEQIHFPNHAKPKRFDVSICCTNMYDNGTFTDQYIPRKQLIDDLANASDINFALFGPQHLRAAYPNHYQGHVTYAETNDVFNASHIVLCTHVCHSYSQYINERTVLALGAGSLLLVDAVKDLDTVIPSDCYIVLDRTNYIAQIRQILKADADHMRQNGLKWALSHATWSRVAKKFHEQIVTHFFDPIFYRQQLPADSDSTTLDDQHLLQDCLEKTSLQFCQQREKKNISRGPQLQLKMDFENWSRVNALLSQHQTTTTLQELQQIVDSNSNLDVNRLLEAHFASKDCF